MGTQRTLPPRYGPDHTALVNKIIEKTVEGKIDWTRTSTGASAKVEGKLFLYFVRSPLSALFPPMWALFVAKDNKGKVILNVRNKPLAPFLPFPEHLVAAVSRLYRIVLEMGKAEIDEAIAVVDDL